MTSIKGFGKVLAVFLTVCLCLSVSGASAARDTGLVLLNGRENKSASCGTDTWYADCLTAQTLAGVGSDCTVVYREDGGVASGLTPNVHGEYKTTVNGCTVKLVPMDEVIVLPAGEYFEDYDAAGRRVLLVLENGASLTGTLTGVSLSLHANAHWRLTGDSVLAGLDACRASLRNNVFGCGHIGWYDSEVHLSADMREWTEQLADTLGGWTSFSDSAVLGFDDYRSAVLAGEKSAVISRDNVFISIFPLNLAALVTASVFDGTVDTADVTAQSGVYAGTDEYAELREGCGYDGGDIAYGTLITADPAANGQYNRSCVYATNSTVALSDVFINEKSYATSVVYADGTNRSQDAMMKYGVNAAVWAQGEKAVIDLDRFYCVGANDGLYATYGGTVIAQNGVLSVTANHGLQICYDGTILARNMDIITTGMMGSAISSDHGGGFLFCDDVFALAAYDSTGGAGIYCDGYCDFHIRNSAVGSLHDHGAVMCGGGTLELLNTTLFSRYDGTNASVAKKDAGAPSGGAQTTVTPGAGVYVHPMGNNPGRPTTLRLTDSVLKVPGYGVWTFGKSANITVCGTLDVTELGSGILLYAKQMDGGSAFMGGKTLDQAYDIPENITKLTFDGGTLLGVGDVCRAAEDDASGNYARIEVALVNGSDYSGAVCADVMSVDESSVWHCTGESVIGILDCAGVIDGTVTQQADGSFLVVPAGA